MPSTMEGVAPNDPAPVRIGPYRLEKTIGVGSFGKVKRRKGLPLEVHFHDCFGVSRRGHISHSLFGFTDNEIGLCLLIHITNMHGIRSDRLRFSDNP